MFCLQVFARVIPYWFLSHNVVYSFLLVFGTPSPCSAYAQKVWTVFPPWFFHYDLHHLFSKRNCRHGSEDFLILNLIFLYLEYYIRRRHPGAAQQPWTFGSRTAWLIKNSAADSRATQFFLFNLIIKLVFWKIIAYILLNLYFNSTTNIMIFLPLPIFPALLCSLISSQLVFYDTFQKEWWLI